MAKIHLEDLIIRYVANINSGNGDPLQLEKAFNSLYPVNAAAYEEEMRKANTKGLTKDHPEHGGLFEDPREILRRLSNGKIEPPL